MSNIDDKIDDMKENLDDIKDKVDSEKEKTLFSIKTSSNPKSYLIVFLVGVVAGLLIKTILF